MNNNRGNNRRRGRGNNRQQGGGQQLNRIDSRARGNAPQLLEKYRKLAHDAHLNGDRVTEEYNLQFADHYFRVIADTKQRQEEARQQRQERWQDGERYDNDGGEYGADGDYPASPYYGERRDRDEPREESASPEQRSDASGEEQHNGSAEAPYEPVENPFTRESRSPRSAKPRRSRREEPAANGQAEGRQQEGRDGEAGINVAALPPSISSRDEKAEEGAEPAEAKPKRRTRRKPPADDGGEPLQAVN